MQEGTTPAELAKMEAEIFRLLEGTSDLQKASKERLEVENRLREQQNNDRMFVGMKAVLSVFCILLATIGIGNVFSNTLGFVVFRITAPSSRGSAPICAQYARKLASSRMTTGAFTSQPPDTARTYSVGGFSNPPAASISSLISSAVTILLAAAFW